MTAVRARERIEQVLSSAKRIYISACGAEIAGASELFRTHGARDATITGIFSPLVNRGSYVDEEIGLRVRTFFLTKSLRGQLSSGMVDYCPWRYRMIDRWLAEAGRFDTALVMLSPPDANGRCSLGVQADFLPRFVGRVERIVGVINPNMPRTTGDTQIEYSALSTVLETDAPLATMSLRPPDDAVKTIAQSIADLVRDRATVQFGIGQIPSEVIARLGSHRGLRVHSGVVDDNILALGASGALDRNAPVVTGTAVGSQALYAAVSDDKRFLFKSVSFTHAESTIAAIPNFTAVNSVLQADLLGQVSAETSNGKLVASPGGLPDFVRGALNSEGGRSIVALRARGTHGHAGGIVPFLSAPSIVTSGSSDADIIVTEFGVAHVRELSLGARAEAIIAIAAPEDRDELARAWSKLRGSFVQN